MRVLLLLLFAILATQARYIFFKVPQLSNPIDRWHLKGEQPIPPVKRFAGELVFGEDEWLSRFD